MTKYGKMIADVVLSSSDHPTAEDIFLRLKESGTHVSLATVYNNLKSLVDEGTLQKLTMDGSPDRFDKPTHHDHLICANCGRLADVHLGDLTAAIEAETGIHILSYDIRVKYLCDACREELNKAHNEQDT